jgi:hypothetical protein
VTRCVCEKVAQHVAKTTFSNFTVVESSPIICVTSANFHKTTQSKQSPKSQKLAQSGVDVMITILGEKNGVFLKKQCYDHNFCKKTSST